MTLAHNNMGDLWVDLLDMLLHRGAAISPRGMPTREITDMKVVLLNARNNILMHPVRKPSHRFMVAEWLWMFFGHIDVKTIERYNKHIAQFSDDGVSFNGSYGAPIIAQWQDTVDTLKRDPNSRQAVIYIFGFKERRYAPLLQSKDVPCTIALQFLLRGGKLDCIATMRSSDVWLGLPYDMFNFSMLQNILAGQVNAEVGQLSMNLGSSHLYGTNFKAAEDVLKDRSTGQTMYYVPSPALPGAPPWWLDKVLEGDPPPTKDDVPVHQLMWLRYAYVLHAETNQEALTWLTRPELA